jgi:hypothetical protein
MLELCKDLVLKPLRTAVAMRKGIDQPSLWPSLHPGKWFLVGNAMRLANLIRSKTAYIITLVQAPASHDEAGFIRISPNTPIGVCLHKLENFFAEIGSASVMVYDNMAHGVWRKFAKDTTKIRIASVAIGYVDLVLTATLLASLGEKHLGQVGASISEAVRHYAVVLKVSNPRGTCHTIACVGLRG